MNPKGPSAEADEAFGLLRGIDVLAGAPDPLLRAVSAKMVALTLNEGEALVQFGEVADALFVVAEGTFDVRVPRAESDTSVAHLGVGRGIGEMQMLSGGTRAATVVALEQSRAYRLSQADFQWAIGQAPDVFAAMLERVCERGRGAQLAALLAPMLDGLSPEGVAAIEPMVRWVELRRGDLLFDKGDPGEAFMWS